MSTPTRNDIDPRATYPLTGEWLLAIQRHDDRLANIAHLDDATLAKLLDHIEVLGQDLRDARDRVGRLEAELAAIKGAG